MMKKARKHGATKCIGLNSTLWTGLTRLHVMAHSLVFNFGGFLDVIEAFEHKTLDERYRDFSPIDRCLCHITI